MIKGLALVILGLIALIVQPEPAEERSGRPAPIGYYETGVGAVVASIVAPKLKPMKARVAKGEQQTVELKLYSIGGLMALLPDDIRKDVTPQELKKLVKAHGTYRQITEKALVMTEADVRHFFARIANMQPAVPIEPAPSEVGLIAAYGDRAGSGPQHAVVIDWVPNGHELILLDTVRAYCDENATVIKTVDMAYGDFLKWRTEMRADKDCWEHAKFYWRTDKVMKVFQTDEGA